MFFFKVLMALALAAYSTSQKTESKHECDGKDPCYKPLDFPPDEKPGAGGSDDYRPRRSIGFGENLCELKSEMIPPYNVNNVELLYPKMQEYFSRSVNQTYCKNEGAQCVQGLPGRPNRSRCETDYTYQIVTFTIRTDEKLEVPTGVKSGCSCKIRR